MKTILILLIATCSSMAFGQIEIWPEDSLKEYHGDVVPVYTKEYLRKYNRLKRMIVKVYPYALHAANVIDEIDQNAERIQRRRKKNRYFKKSYQGLKDEFKYFILELYTSEGKMLMKLIHRETGMTVYDISSKYRGKQKAQMFNLMAKIWDQDLHVQFNPAKGDDKIAEQVIKDIQSGLVAFDDKIVTIDKLTYRDKKKEEKRQLKEGKKRRKEREKAKKKRIKAAEKKARKKKKANK